MCAGGPLRKALVAASAARTSSRTSRESETLPRFEKDRDRGGGHDERGDQPGEGPADPAHGPVEDEHGEDAFERLGEGDRPDVEAEEPYREGLDEEGAGELVYGDGPPGVEGAEDEVVPALGHAADGAGVEGLELVVADAPDVRQRGQGGDDEQCRAGPGGLVVG